jgi:hypothetical protein
MAYRGTVCVYVPAAKILYDTLVDPVLVQVAVDIFANDWEVATNLSEVLDGSLLVERDTVSATVVGRPGVLDYIVANCCGV